MGVKKTVKTPATFLWKNWIPYVIGGPIAVGCFYFVRNYKVCITIQKRNQDEKKEIILKNDISDYPKTKYKTIFED